MQAYSAPVIAHQAIRMHLPFRFAPSITKRGQELLAVFVVPEDILALIPTAHDVTHGPEYSTRNLRDIADHYQ